MVGSVTSNTEYSLRNDYTIPRGYVKVSSKGSYLKSLEANSKWNSNLLKGLGWRENQAYG